MAMVKRPVVVSLVVAACVVSAASASSRPPDRAARARSVSATSARPVCGPRGPVTLAHDAQARVYRIRGTGWGCARGAAHAWNLGGGGGHEGIYLAALSGVRAAYATGFMGVDTSSSSLTERRLDTGKVVATPQVSDLRTGVEFHVGIVALVIRPGGAMAWTVSASSIGAPHSGAELRTYSHGHTYTLERNHGLDVHSLSLRGSRLRWRDAAGWHSAQLS